MALGTQTPSRDSLGLLPRLVCRFCQLETDFGWACEPGAQKGGGSGMCLSALVLSVSFRIPPLMLLLFSFDTTGARLRKFTYGQAPQSQTFVHAIVTANTSAPAKTSSSGPSAGVFPFPTLTGPPFPCSLADIRLQTPNLLCFRDGLNHCLRLRLRLYLCRVNIYGIQASATDPNLDGIQCCEAL